MEFGSDGRLYVAEYPGTIKVVTIQRNGPTSYQVVGMETLLGVKNILNHDDNGSPCSGSSSACSSRETTGLTVGGTASNPVIYVSSSDFRIGAGSGGGNGDVDLDTNSGIITRLTWTGSQWDVVDLVRGLPRSEENHATNGLELVTINGTNYLLVASGGHTNGGGPSTNFVYTCEYVLAAAVLSVDLDALDALGVKTDGNGRKYIYDLPTLDDPTRANANGITDPDTPGYNGIDVNDPFGGNDGLNQAIVDPSGPVQVYSPGYRNAYDLVVTQSGALYVTDNGANQGWGGFPVGEGTANVTNNYDPLEPGSQSPSGGEQINNLDHLQLVTTDIQNYSPGSYYGGHPNPTRANPNGAGLFTAPASSGLSGSIFRTQIYDPDGSRGAGYTTNPNLGLPANWPPVASANPIEGDWRGPGISNPDGPDDNPVTIWGTNTNAIAEYTASNFGGAMQGNLLAGHNSGVVRRVQLKTDGTLQTLTSTFLSGIGGNVLGLTCNGDTDIFPGTIWTGTLNGNIVVFEPQDFVECLEPGDPGYSASGDNDSDGYTNQDEIDNGTDPCNGGSQPADWDKAAGAPLVSDLNDTDDDADGIPDASDPFQLGDPTTAGSDAFTLPVNNDLFNDQQGLGGIFGLGLTGLMNNGDTGANWMNWLDRRDDPNDPNPNDVLGGAPGLMTSHMTSGTALGATNTQEKGYQYGVQIDQNSGIITAVGNLVGLTGPLRLYGNTAAVGGELGHFIGDGTQSNYIKMVLNTNGITALQEINDVPQPAINVPIAVGDRPVSEMRFFFVINTGTGQVELQYAIDGGTRTSIGTLAAQGSVLTAIQSSSQDLAVGFIGTSGTAGVELEGTWDFLNVIGEVPTIAQQIPDITRGVSSADEQNDLDSFFDDDGGVANLTYTVAANTNPAIGASINGNTLTLSYPATPTTSQITIRATDAETFFVEQTFTVTVTDAPVVLYRVNTGGPQLSAIDGGLAWGADQTGNPSAYLLQAGTNQVFPSSVMPVDGSVNQATTPLQIYATERYDGNPGAPNLAYSFPVAQPGNYEIRLYMGNSFAGTSQPGQRIFDVQIEGALLPLLNDIDLSDTYGHQIGTVISHIRPVTDGAIDITFLHGAIENPLINGIEIVDVPDNETPIYVYPIVDQASQEGEQLSGSLGVVALGGDGNLQYSATGLPPGISIEPTNGQIGGTISAGAIAGSPYLVIVTLDDSDAGTSDAVSISFDWNVTSGNSAVWTDKAENEGYTARHECSFVQAGDRFYLMGGRESAKTVEIYDYTTNTWAALTNSAPFEFNHYQATEYQGLIWVIGAFKDNNFPTETPADFIWIFDPAMKEWIQGPEIPAARKRGSAGLVVYNDKFYIVGGNTDGHDGGFVAWFDEFDPATGVWTPLANAPRARDHFHSAVIGDKLYLAGGRLSGGTGGVWAPTIPEVDVYDFITGTWSTLPAGQNIPTPRGGSTSVNFNGKLIVIGGEVQNQLVYGVNTDDALKITEQYDPVTQIWQRLPDMNFERHGTQAIVSGGGVFILAGAPNRGGGFQQNMEFLGEDAPVGAPSVASVLSAPESVVLADGQTQNISLDVTGGNVAVFIRSITVSGANASDFSLDAGALSNAILSPNASQVLQVTLNGTGADRSAVLTIDYGASSTLNIALTNNPDLGLTATNPGNQFNYEGDVVSLPILANSANALSYQASGLPPTLSINPNTGVISGTIQASGGGSGAFQEQNGLLVVEAESQGTVPNWTLTNADGEVGILAGTNSFNNQNGGTIPYQIQINTPGVYRFIWNSFYSGPSPTDENDNWLRFPNNSNVWFFGYQGATPDETTMISNLQGAQTNVVFPVGSGRESASTTPEGASSNGYFKIFKSGGQSQTYEWEAFTSDFDAHNIYVWFVNAGTYTMEISERSAGHAIDRFALYKVDGPDYTPAQLDGFPESPRSGGSSGAAAGSPYAVTVTVTDDAQPPAQETLSFTWTVGIPGELIAVPEADPLTGDAPLTVNFTGSNSLDDVGVISYLWDFGDGSPSSSEADPNHVFNAVGDYSASLTVEDADGNTSTNSVLISVTSPVTQAPVVDAGADQEITLPVNSSILPGSASDPDGGVIQSYSWTQVSGPSIASLSGSDTATLTAGDLIAGVYVFRLTATDDDLETSFDEVQVTVNPAPTVPPLANAGADQEITLPVNSVVLTGSASDPDGGSIVNYAWTQQSGPAAATLAGSDTEVLTASDLAEGIYIFRLTVLDDETESAFDEVQVTVFAAPVPPLVDAGPDQQVVLPVTSAVLPGSATDPDGGAILTYLWTQQSGPATATLTGADTPALTASDLVEGVYVFRLTVVDDETESAFDEVQVTVFAAPEPPVVDAGPDQNIVLPNDVASLNGTANDPDGGSIASYEWSQQSGPSVATFGSAAAEDTGVSGLVEGTYVFRLTVTDDDGQIGFDEITVTVSQHTGNAAPTAVASADPVSGEAPLSVQFIGRNSSDDFGIVSFFWNFNDGTTSNEVDPSHIFEELGEYLVVLTVTDAEGLTDTTSLTITVNDPSGNIPPLAMAGATPISGDAPLLVEFTGSNSDDDGTIVSYFWDFGDGATSDLADPQHTYAGTGSFTAVLTVTDDGGLSDTDEITIIVVDRDGNLEIIIKNPVRNGKVELLIRNLPPNEVVIGFRLFEYSGKLIRSFPAQPLWIPGYDGQDEGVFIIPVDDIPAGIYFIQVEFLNRDNIAVRVSIGR